MKKITLFYLFLALTCIVQAQKDSLPITKTETKSTATYYFSSSFKGSKTKSVKEYLENELGKAKHSNSRRCIWDSIGLPLGKTDIIRVELRTGYIEMSWANKVNPSNSAAIIQELEKLASQIAILIKDV
jgi:hypothetical protein